MPSSRKLPPKRADALAAQLDVDLDCGICHLCLSFVSSALDEGDEAEIRRRTFEFTPWLWSEGLEDPALAALRRACDRGVADAEVALAELEEHAFRSAVARSIVRRLAEELSRQTRIELRLVAAARARLGEASPGLN